MEQLMHWTAQILQRMLKAAERATLEARGDLEAAVKELAEERKQCDTASVLKGIQYYWTWIGFPVSSLTIVSSFLTSLKGAEEQEPV